ncbi:MAG: CDP-diacylglycerol--serine O-phosphatidyltransferase [Proteobacteria bacterium]|nr:CDP-diacylglycerol--serine O-phosphatidyltransferase [Pseudomonadota bacterium]
MRGRTSMMTYIMKPANLFTGTSLLCGLASIMVSAEAKPHESTAFFTAALLIMYAGIFDTLDGRVARWTKTQSEFGVQMDSLVDVVSFGVAPGVLLYKWGLEAYGRAGFIVAFAFVLCGVFRLSRFNMKTMEEDVSDGPKRYTEGLAITAAGGMVASLVLFHAETRATEVSNHVGVLLLTVLLSYLMVSTVRFRTFREVRMTPVIRAFVAGLVASIVVVLVIQEFTILLVAVGGSYIGYGLLDEILTFGRRRRADDAFYLAELPDDEEVTDEEEAHA